MSANALFGVLAVMGLEGIQSILAERMNLVAMVGKKRREVCMLRFAKSIALFSGRGTQFRLPDRL